MSDVEEKVSRFLMQATLGADQQTIDAVAEVGMETWLDRQLAAPPESDRAYQTLTAEIWQFFRRRLLQAYGETAINGDGNNPALPYKWYFHMAWWHKALSANPEDLLRQRVAQALSELLVISDNSQLELNAIGMASYYDLLYKHAFGSYSDLLYEVSLHPCMGVYLSHMNNRKADPAKHIHPDENYAREIMQLFSIGLYQLNKDGTHKQDAKGRDIPSYDNTDIKQLARVFTGLTADSYEYEWITSFWGPDYNGYPVAFDDGIEKSYKTVPFVNMVRPMHIDENYHDRQPKKLLNGHITLRGGESGYQEIRKVVKQLVTHPNTAPFVATHLIKQLVTSNPSPEYVRTVAEAFGPRGNIKAAVRKILSYPLSHNVRKDSTQSGNKVVESQKLKSPLLRSTQLLRAFRVYNQSGRLWLTGEVFGEELSQHPLSAPTVFNFYKPDFAPHGAIQAMGLVAPEFELHNSATSIAYVNLMYHWFFGDYYPGVSTVISQQPGITNVPELDPDVLAEYTRDKLQLDFTEEIVLARDRSRHDELIDHMSVLLTGKRHLSIKPQIKKAFSQYADHPQWVVQTIAFMIAISPDFTVLEA